MPTLVSIISEPSQVPDGLIAGAVDLISTLMAPSSLQQAQRMHHALTGHVIKLAEHSDDAEVIRSCCAYLRCSMGSACKLPPLSSICSLAAWLLTLQSMLAAYMLVSA